MLARPLLRWLSALIPQPSSVIVTSSVSVTDTSIAKCVAPECRTELLTASRMTDSAFAARSPTIALTGPDSRSVVAISRWSVRSATAA